MHFPNLKFLDLEVWDALLLAIAASPRFPLIQHLKVVCEDPSPLTDILVKCANTLESMDLTYDRLPSKSPDITPTIHFPRLRTIQLVYKTGSHWYINASTPNLEAYIDDGRPNFVSCKLDVRNVTYLHVVGMPDLSRFPRLVTLLVDGRIKYLMEAIDFLRKHPQCSPDLAVIGYFDHISIEELEEVTTALLAYAEETGRQVTLERDQKKIVRKDDSFYWTPVRLLANGKRPV